MRKKALSIQRSPSNKKSHSKIEKGRVGGREFKLHTSELNKIIDAALLYKEQAAKADHGKLSGKKAAACSHFAGCCFLRDLYIVVEIKLMRVRPQFNIVDLIFGFIVNPHINGILGENITLHEKLLIGL